MSVPPRTFDQTVLLAHASWVRSLARSLVPLDIHLADDLAQDACLAALESRPSTNRALGGWLATVLKNLVRQSRRGSARRNDREQRAARPEALPSVLGHVEALSVHRELVDAVLALDEPYRETIVLRYFQELSPSRIAREKHLPVATVKTRLARALDLLRERLDRAHGGDDSSWLQALIPFCKPSGGAAAPTLGALLVSTNAKIATAAVLVACGVLVWWSAREPSRVESAREAQRAAVVDVAAPAEKAVLAVDARAVERAPLAATPAATTSSDVAPAAVVTEELHGRVIDVTALPQAGLRVFFSAGRREISGSEFDVPRPTLDATAPSVTSDAAGAFVLSIPNVDGELAVADERWTTVLASLCGPRSSKADCIVVVAPRLSIGGHVVDEAGRAIAGARLEIRLPRDLRAGLPHILDRANRRGWITRSDDAGRFRFADAPRVDGATLHVEQEGFGTTERDAPTWSDGALEIVLPRHATRPGTVAGRVLDADGRAVADAHVALGHTAITRSDESGAFALEIPRRDEREAQSADLEWIAVKTGHQPAIQAASAAVRRGEADPGEFVELRLGPPPLTIAGRVVDADDKPCAGLKVFVVDPTFFGATDEVPAHVEGMLAGAADRAVFERMMASAPEGSNPEAMLRDTSSVFWTFARTGPDGRFELGGLLDRDYRLAALDPETLLRIESKPIPAGTRDCELRLPKNMFVENVRGRVVTSSGEPVAGVLLTPKHEVLTVHIDAHSWSSFDVEAASVTSDAEGRFAFARLPREHVYLALTSDDIVPVDWARDDATGIESAAGKQLDAIVIRVALRYHFQVESAPDVADEVRVVDADGKPVMINVFEGSSHMSTDTLPLSGGRSKVMAVGEDARTLVVSRGGLEVRRVPLALVRGERNVVRL